MGATDRTDVRLNYHQSGRGPDLVMVHGLAANLAFWKFRIVPLIASRFRVSIYDLRGHGYSEMPRNGYSSSEMVDDLRSFLDMLGLSRVHLVGHSFGGRIALQFTVRFPERVSTLTIADSRFAAFQPTAKLKDWNQWPRWKNHLTELGLTIDEEQEMDFGLFELLARNQRAVFRRSSPPAAVAPFDTWSLGRRGSEQWLRLLEETSARRDFKKRDEITAKQVESIEQPTQAIYGQYSFCLPSYHGLRRHLRDVRAEIVPRAGHFHPIRSPKEFAGSLHSFHSEVESRGQP